MISALLYSPGLILGEISSSEPRTIHTHARMLFSPPLSSSPGLVGLPATQVHPSLSGSDRGKIWSAPKGGGVTFPLETGVMLSLRRVSSFGMEGFEFWDGRDLRIRDEKSPR